MGVLRLLFCDSAGVRRCRAVTFQGELPLAGDDAADAAAPAAAPSSKPSGSLTHTPSILDAAAAGVITLRPKAAVVGSDSAAASPQSGSPLAGRPAAASGEGALAQASGLRSATAQAPAGAAAGEQQLQQVPSLRSTPSMLHAAAAGVISLRPRQAAPAGSTGGRASSGGGSGLSRASSLRTTPSLLYAAAAGIISMPPRARVSFASSTMLLDQQPSGSWGGASGGAGRGVRPSAFQSASAAAAAAAASPVAARLPSAELCNGGGAGGSSESAALAAAAEFSTGLVRSCMAVPVYADVVVPGAGLAPVGEVLLVPDLDAAVALPWAPGHAVAPVDMMLRDLSEPWACCPRSALKYALSTLEVVHGLSLMCGFELEFVLLRRAPEGGRAVPDAAKAGVAGWLPVDESVYCQSSSFDEFAYVLDDMVAALTQMGIGVLQYHAEAAPAQFEIALEPYPALEACDKLLLAKEALGAVARRHGLAVTFAPKPLAGYAGSGLHCHLSLWMTGGAGSAMVPFTEEDDAVPPHTIVPGYPALSKAAAAFLNGLLSHLPGLLPLTAPSTNSYARLQPRAWAGGFQCWGWDNREAPLRLCCPSGPDSCNAEYKAFDGSTNPYIGVAALLAAGLLGLQKGECLPAPVQVDPGAAGNGLADAPAQLPGSLTAALEALEKDGDLKAKLEELLGPALLTAFLAVRRDEAAASPSIETLLLRY